ncbi:hypothetical protein GCM10011326_45980 [Salipiger profundus]|nr:hypothetical protein GCM10011326_45980 [Salipiger profundus]
MSEGPHGNRARIGGRCWKTVSPWVAGSLGNPADPLSRLLRIQPDSRPAFTFKKSEHKRQGEQFH